MEPKTVFVRLKRSVLIDGEHCDPGEIHELPADLAEYLIAADSATTCFWAGLRGSVVRQIQRLKEAWNG